MNFVYFACEFYRISNAFTYETLILNYNSEPNLGICFYFIFNLHIYVMILKLTYIYNFKNIFI